MKITIIGNNGNNCELSDGGRIKLRLYKTLLEKEGYIVNIIELDGWKRHIFSLVSKIKQAIKNKDRIIIMAGPKGCRLIIPLVYHLNKKHKTPVVFCALGVGTIDYIIKNKKPEDAQRFIGGDFQGFKKDLKMGRILSSLECVILQNNVLMECYKKYYGLNNLAVIENFRYVEYKQKKFVEKDTLDIVYFSRVRVNKGIFDLIDVIKCINRDESIKNVKLDIIGDNQLLNDDKVRFESLLDENIKYKGIIKNSDAIDVLQKYDVFCLPTKYHGEGTPGSLIEAMIAGTVPVISSYSQASNIIQDGYDGLIFKFNSPESLKEKILYLLNNKEQIKKMSQNVQQTSKKYLYEGNRDCFLLYLAGEKR